MAEVRARGVIIKQSDYGEGHRMLTVFTAEYGIVKAVSYGVKKTKSKSASSQFLCYGNFTFYKSSNKDIMTVNNIDTLDGFYPICEDIQKLSLCVYFADITYNLLGMNNPDERILHMFLNSLYALAYKEDGTQKVKTVYELKLMCAGGYMPSIHSCASCGSAAVTAFDLLKGGMVCAACGGKYLVKMDKSLFNALSYISSCEDKRMLSFNASADIIDRMNALTEQYISLQLDQTFQSLDYYKTILKM